LAPAGKKKTGPQQFLDHDLPRGHGPDLGLFAAATPAPVNDRICWRCSTRCRRARLLLADAGFTGYDLLLSILGGEGGRSFIPARGRQRCGCLTKLGWCCEEHRDGIVYLWP